MLNITISLYKLEKYKILPNPPKLHKFVSLPLESSFNLNPMIHAMIINLKAKEQNKEKLYEYNYSRITSVLLPYYFPFSSNWCISP